MDKNVYFITSIPGHQEITIDTLNIRGFKASSYTTVEDCITNVKNNNSKGIAVMDNNIEGNDTNKIHGFNIGPKAAKKLQKYDIPVILYDYRNEKSEHVNQLKNSNNVIDFLPFGHTIKELENILNKHFNN